ncbi:MAG: prepilin-type N-terminal cleavage/methylation domain-containing protein [Burkholderiales bacterium]
MKPHRLCALSRGFTLVEVLVAMTVMAIMAVMAWQGVDGIVRSRNASQVRLEQTLRLNTVIAQWGQDLASIQDSTAVPSPIRCDGASVRMVRRTPDGLQVVAWSYRPDENGGGSGAWVRWAGPSVATSTELTDSWLRSLQLQGNEPGSLRTLTGLTGWQVYFYQNNSWGNCQSSLVQNTPSTRPPPPDGVRVVLSFAPDSGVSGDLTRDIQLGL